MKREKVISKVLNQRQKKEVDTNTILQMMDAVLENNNFSFNNKQYIQTEGTAIGSKLGTIKWQMVYTQIFSLIYAFLNLA